MFIVYLSGPVAVGKSSLVQILEKKNFRVSYEKANKNPWLAKQFKDPENFTFLTQLWYAVDTLKDAYFIQQHPGNWIIDRGGNEMYEIFIPTMVQQGFISLEQQELLKTINNISYKMTMPNLVVALNASPEELLIRLKKRGNDYEQCIDLDWYKKHCALYESFWQKLVRNKQNVILPPTELTTSELANYLIENISNLITN
jgi:deoxyadenosine/deoxycytidine kinase